MLVSGEQARMHLKVDGTDDGADIDLKTRAAEILAEQFLDRRVFESQSALDAAIADGSAGVEPMVVNDLVRAAILLILGHLYRNRTDNVTGTIAVELPMNSRDLLRPFRRVGV
jgi:hypothetical protein